VDEEYAKELVDFAMDILGHVSSEELDDALILLFIESLSGIMVAFKIMNPNFTDRQILDQICDQIKMAYIKKARVEGLNKIDALIN
jgi:hypothetical protein